jgi:lipoic acid synthetase|uniref:Lipoyl synthase n=1 Tax=Candidatus Caldatribacterium californiense TaxID=1454726 RepID=A0A7V3YI57_9BACT
MSSLPSWIRRRFPPQEEWERVERLLRSLSLHTVCESARCPNLGECFRRGTATFLILGDTCTRSCRFCAVKKGIPLPPDPEEPRRVAEAARTLNLRHVVVTSVTRDDLPDGGAEHFAKTIQAIRECLPQATVEVLVPDFQGSAEALEVVLAACPDVLNHNVETVPRLYPLVRPQADYARSLELLRRTKVRYPGILVKSGLMVGLGETQKEVEAVLWDLKEVGCDVVTIGQYLRPTAWHLPVAAYVPPEVFAYYREYALRLGFRGVASGPFVRSSYRAEEFVSV